MLIAATALWVPKADAMELPAQDLVDKIKNTISDTKNVTIYNQIYDQATQQLAAEQKSESKIPPSVENLAEVERAVEFASAKTGVRKDFLMGMLVVESDLGRNPGKCTYAEIKADAEKSHRDGRLGKAAWNTFLRRKELVKSIADDLGYDYNKLQVSCNPGNYAGTGGAMGIPQFMPDTWFEYKDRIAAVVGKDNPDPWNVTDGVVAMALKVSDVPGVVQHNVWAERNASKMYLSGTTSARYDWYATQIQYWARNYASLIG